MIRITEIEEHPIGYFPYLNAGGGKLGKILNRNLPIYKAYVEELPDGLDAVLVTSDLQGNVRDDEYGIQLLGEVLPEFLSEWLYDTLELDSRNMGAMLCGDMFAVLHKRGGLGDVRPVWWAFRDHFKWVAGVAGNHDDFGTFQEKMYFSLKEKGIHFLERGEKELDGIRVGGVSGIVGSKKRKNRVPESDFLDYIFNRLANEPDVLLLHEGPGFFERGLGGNHEVREILEMSNEPTLVCCGHCHWWKHLVELENGTQILNADAKVFVLVEKDETK